MHIVIIINDRTYGMFSFIVTCDDVVGDHGVMSLTDTAVDCTDTQYLSVDPPVNEPESLTGIMSKMWLCS